jgi:hypothetical protein
MTLRRELRPQIACLGAEATDDETERRKARNQAI